jgi:phospholipid/cholesterol/gamma-HCH transport system substrate-binding protein
MNATPNRQAVIVGLFVAVGATILAGGILTIGDLNDTFTRKLAVSAVFDEVGGLQKGDNIWYAGVKVGVVKALEFDEASRVVVDMRIDEEAARVIHGDALAKIGSEGLIGSTIVVIHGGTAGTTPLEEGDVLAVTKSVSTEDIMATFQQNNTNLVAITTDLKSISASLSAGEGSIGKLLGDDALYVNVAAAVSRLEDAAEHAGTMTASLSTFAAELNREGGLPHDLVTDRTTYASLTEGVEAFQQAGAHASDFMEVLASGAGNANTPLGTLAGDEAAGLDLKGSLDNLHLGSRLLVEDLEAAQHNFLLRGYFKKKEREHTRAEGQASVPEAPAADTP